MRTVSREPGRLFSELPPARSIEPLAEGASLLRGFATEQADGLVELIAIITANAPFRHLVTPGGRRMSVGMTNCGPFGWVSDLRGYRYEPADPDSGEPWPPMPTPFERLAREAAAEAGFPGFKPDGCLINCYEPGTRLTLHQDKDEKDPAAPIVSVSLGLPATFLWGGMRRGDATRRIRLESGDVAVWGGPARFTYHGIATLADGDHVLTGKRRFNLTFRRTGLTP